MGASLSNIQLDKEYLLQAENTEINLVALSSVFALPSITIDDVDGSASSAAISVVEASQDTVTGTFRVQSEAGLAAVMINGIDISQARSDNVITFLTGYGTLRITGFEPSTGVFQYDYTDNGLAKDHSYGNYSVIDQFVITVMDQVGQSVSNTLDVMILDTEGSGQDDFGVMTEDTSSISGNVLANDVLSADAPHSLTFWNEVNGVVVGKWGTLHVQSNGDWVYQLNKDLPQVQGLKDNQALNEEFRYLLVDADDDQILRSLFVKIEGVTDADPVIFIPDSSNTVGAVDLILTEGSGTQVQSYFTVQADAGIKKLTFLDIEITDSVNTTPLTIGTSKGMLVIYSYDMAKGKISFTYTEGMRAHNHNANDDNIFDQFMISLTDNEGKVTNKPLTVWIADTEPNANNDVANMTSDQSAISGNVITNDFAGADALAGVVFNGAIAGAQAGTKVVQGKYGLLIFSEATGEWTYELDQNNPALTQLPLGSVITENFIYGLKDADGDASYAALDISVKTVDTTAPSVILSMSDQALKLGETAVVTFSFSEMVTGFDLRDVTVENGTLSNLQTADGGKTWTATFTAAANVQDASNTISVKDGSYTDLAGNVGTGNFINYAIDNVAPSVILSMSDQALKLGETAVVTFSFSEMVTGFDLRDVTVENGTLSNLQTADGGKTWTATFIATANVDDASNTISVKDGSYTDLAGNVGTGNFINYAIDNVAPSVVLSMSDQALKLGETAVVTFSFSEMVTGFDLRDVTVENGTLSNLQTADGGKTWTATFIATANVDDASNTISVKDGSYTDLAGNVGTGNFINYAIDNVAPNSGTTAIMVDNITADNVVNGKEAKENVLVTGKVSGEFQVGDVVTLVLNGNRYLTQVLNTAGDYSTFVKGSDLVADSDHTLDASVAAHDAAGNVGIVGTQKAYGIDVSVDPALLVLNNFYDSFNPYVAGTSSDMLSNDRNYDLSVIGLEVGGFAQYQLWNGFSWVNTTSAQINMADGPYQYRAVVTDAYGNDPYITQTITLEVDATAPAMPTGVALTDRVLSGTAEAGTTVIVSDGDRVIATTTAQANGQFSVTLSTMPSRAGLSVTSMDLAGNESVPAVPGYHYRVWTVASSWTNTEGPLAYRPNYCSYNVYEPYRTSSGNDWIEIGNGPQRNWCYPEQGSIWSYYCNTVTLIAMGAGNDRLDTGVSGGKGSMYSNTQVDMGTGDDVFNLKGDMYGNSQVAMGDGDDVFNVGQSIRDSSKVNLGNGNDVLRVGGYVEDCAVVNAGEGDNVVTVGGVIDNAKITFGSGNDQLTVTGEFNGCDATASMGAGDDILTFTGKKVVGQLEGGSGFDTLVLDYTADNSLVNSCVNVTNLSSANFTGFELIKMEGKNAVDIRYCDLAADTSRTGALFIQGGRDSKVDLGGNNWNSDSTWMRDLTDSSGWRMESWRKCGSTIMDDVAYDIYRHSAGGYNYINDVYIQQGIQVI